MRIIVLAIMLLSFQSVAAQVPSIWFAPNHSEFLGDRSKDYLWSSSINKIKVFKFYYQAILSRDSSELKKEFDFLHQNNIKIAIEFPALEWEKNGIGYNIEGFQEPGFTKKVVDKLRTFNGTIDYISIDEPIFFAHYKSGDGHPQMSIQDIAKNSSLFLKPILDEYPDLIVGDIEPFMAMPDLSDQQVKEMLGVFVEKFNEYSGRKISYIHSDVDWKRDWKRYQIPVQEFAEENGLRFGLIFNSSMQGLPSEGWVSNARNNIISFLGSGFKEPNDVIIQSWNKSPQITVDDRNKFSMSSLIIDYAESSKAYKK
ncbi:hypothetical protein [Klebsiella michiganensis]|uniref:Uncharacterized protein n=2 Tax=Klebsiella michiganensis TaxID=1134687 RepID=A0AAX3CKK3_9ENTR|nr:hypothetical protein [Klebsiella michiganensis]QLW90581.1 hypothetical protein HV175_19260 [Klebsiella oxytoca]DAQ51566.1 MAG TPA: hypothetical protein [Caudoviricetes sp.]HBX5204030.1 hypothetical protein [Klebsiella pneumoniae]MDU6583288.1 hypothetical protein [Klebsiella michiganensis]PSI97500.1 hypothetical protein C6400_24455 [Klebsiella michiganensis]